MIGSSILAAAMAAFSTESETLAATAASLDPEEFSKAALALLEAPRIAASGCGHSGIACRHFAHLMCCIERPARFISPAEAVHGALGFLKKGDVMVLVSRGGATGELLPILEICLKKEVFVICVTEKPDSPLARGAGAVLRVSVTRECDRYNCQGTSSFAATCAVFDALQCAVLELSGFDNREFALIHPAGAVGKRLAGELTKKPPMV